MHTNYIPGPRRDPSGKPYSDTHLFGVFLTFIARFTDTEANLHFEYFKQWRSHGREICENSCIKMAFLHMCSGIDQSLYLPPFNSPINRGRMAPCPPPPPLATPVALNLHDELLELIFEEI